MIYQKIINRKENEYSIEGFEIFVQRVSDEADKVQGIIINISYVNSSTAIIVYSI